MGQGHAKQDIKNDFEFMTTADENPPESLGGVPQSQVIRSTMARIGPRNFAIMVLPGFALMLVLHTCFQAHQQQDKLGAEEAGFT